MADLLLGAKADVTAFATFLHAHWHKIWSTIMALVVPSTPHCENVSVDTPWQERGLVERFPCPEERRATIARLTEQGWATAPGHVANVRHHVLDALTREQVAQLRAITDALLERLDASGSMVATYQRYDEDPRPPVR